MNIDRVKKCPGCGLVYASFVLVCHKCGSRL